MSSMQQESKSHEELEEVRALFEREGLGHWSVVPMHGTAGDGRAYFRGERCIGPKQEIIHREAAVLVQLAKSVDARLPVSKPVAIATDTASTSSY